LEREFKVRSENIYFSHMKIFC